MTTATMANESQPKFRRMALSNTDWRAVEYLQSRLNASSFSETVRACIYQQRHLDVCMGSLSSEGREDAESEMRLIGGLPSVDDYRIIVKSLIVSWEETNVRRGAKRMRRLAANSVRPRTDEFGHNWICRFWTDDEKSLAKVMSGWNFRDVASAVRFCIRVQASLRGFKPPGGGW